MIYLELNTFESKNKLRAYQEDYNQRMKDANPKTYKTLQIKSNVMRTAEHLLDFYSKHLHLQAKSKPMLTRAFITNSQALATRLGYTKRTTYNHLEKLMEAGIIKDKVFRGTNTGFVIEFNTEILVARKNNEFTQSLIAQYCYLLKTDEVSDEILTKIANATLSFSDAKNGIVKNLQHISTRTLQELNINMQKGIVDNDNSSVDKSNTVEEVVINNDRLLQEPPEQLQEPGLHIGAKNHAGKTGQSPEKIKEIEVRRASHAAYQFLVAVFYSDRLISDHDVNISLMHLQNFFAKARNSKELTQKFNEFIQRAMLVRSFLLKAPGRFIPNPQKWLDPAFEQGFVGTEAWLKNVDKKREERSEYYGNLKVLAKLYREFIISPTLQNYLAGRQTLGKKKNPELLNLYDQAIVSQVPHIAEYYNSINQNAA